MSVYLVDENGRPLCPEADYRDSLADDEFWDHVFNGHVSEPDYDDVSPEVAAEWELTDRLANPCPECGQRGACAYDAEGRALIHVSEGEDCS